MDGFSQPEQYGPPEETSRAEYPTAGYPTQSGYSGEQPYPYQQSYPHQQPYPYPQGYRHQYGYPGQQGWYPPPPAGPSTKRHRGRAIAVAGVVAALAAAGITAGLVSTSGDQLVAGAGSAATSGNSNSGGTGSGSGGLGSGGLGAGGLGSGGTGSGGLDTASASQEIGIVDIDTVLKYQSAQAAGTGMILSSDGEVLTNNHVVDGATTIQVTVVATGKTYSASVVGTDPTDDVAVLKLSGASGLKTIKTSSSAVAVGASVTGVGNAGGTGGTPSAASGTVTAISQTITASDQSGAHAETLTGLIQTNANIQPGDSGGPLFNSSDEVIGMDTAASVSSATASRGGFGAGGGFGGGFGATGTAGNQGYAIPISTAISIAKQISAGKQTSAIHIGLPAFLGISVDAQVQASGAAIAGVVAGLPAAQAGIVAGDVITSIGGTTINSAADLQSVVAGYRPGQSATVAWTDTSGAARSAHITFVQGPAD